MASNIWKILTILFTICCITMTLVLSGWWAYQYSLNEDRCTVEFKDHSDDNETDYPSMTLCFRDPFTSFIKNGNEQQWNLSKMLSYFSGDENFEIIHVDYENVSLRITDYVIKYWIRWRNGSATTFLPHEFKFKGYQVTYSGFRDGNFYKCFTIGIPNRHTRVLSALIDNKIFPNGIRPTFNGLLVIFHYPNQMLRTTSTMKYMWTNRKNKNDYTMRFLLQNVEIFNRRRKCHLNWQHYDKDVVDHHIEEVGCRPPYLLSNHSLPICKTRKEMHNISSCLSLGISHGLEPPCRAMENVNYIYQEIDLSATKWNSSDHFWSTLHVEDSRYKVDVEVKPNFVEFY